MGEGVEKVAKMWVRKGSHLCQRRRSDQAAKSGTRRAKINNSFIITILIRQTLLPLHLATTTKLTPTLTMPFFLTSHYMEGKKTTDTLWSDTRSTETVTRAVRELNI